MLRDDHTLTESGISKIGKVSKTKCISSKRQSNQYIITNVAS